MPFEFNPSDGYRNTVSFPTNPASETDFRDSMQGLLDQIRDYINASLATKAQEAWVAATLINGWTYDNAATIDGSNWNLPSYRKDQFGNVHIRGRIKGGAVSSETVLFTLPAGYRPLKRQIIRTISNDGASNIMSRYDICSNGEVRIITGGNSYFVLDGGMFDSGA